MGKRWALAGLLVPALFCALAAPAARADDAPTVTLSGTPTVITFGGSVTLAGAIAPVAAGETVHILDPAESEVASATTDDSGAYSVTYKPSANVTLHAEWNTAASDPISLSVRPAITVNLTTVWLFGQATISGKVLPPHPGSKPTVKLWHLHKVVGTALPTMTSLGGFTAHLPVTGVGTYHATVTFGDTDHLTTTKSSVVRTTPLPYLHTGSHSVFVSLLEHRLVALHYRLVGLDLTYDYRTADAVMAFRKVQGMNRITTVDSATWRALAVPFRPAARSKIGGFHIEVNQTKQVLYTVSNGAITHIMHVSSGKPSTPTPDGWYSVWFKIPGYSPKGLYYPSFFNQGRAIHGWTEVPSYPASHGCVRVPYWNAQWIYYLAPLGTKVFVYH